MTTIYEYIESLRGQGIDLEVTKLDTLRVLPEITEWEDRRAVVDLLGLRWQVARALRCNENRIIDEAEKQFNLRALKLQSSSRVPSARW